MREILTPNACLYNGVVNAYTFRRDAFGELDRVKDLNGKYTVIIAILTFVNATS